MSNKFEPKKLSIFSIIKNRKDGKTKDEEISFLVGKKIAEGKIMIESNEYKKPMPKELGTFYKNKNNNIRFGS